MNNKRFRETYEKTGSQNFSFRATINLLRPLFMEIMPSGDVFKMFKNSPWLTVSCLLLLNIRALLLFKIENKTLSITATVGTIIIILILVSIIFIRNKHISSNEQINYNNEKKRYAFNFNPYKTTISEEEIKEINPFEGLSLDDAKRKKKILLKKYHPDQMNGSTEMSQIINEAFNEIFN